MSPPILKNTELPGEGSCVSSPFLLPHRLFSQIPVINDDLPMKILSGAVVIKPNVKEIRGSTVVFEDDSTVEKVREVSPTTVSETCLHCNLGLIPCLFGVTGGHPCVCHRIQLRLPLFAKKCHVQVWAPYGSVQACISTNPGASHSGCCGFHSRPWSHHASG